MCLYFVLLQMCELQFIFYGLAPIGVLHCVHIWPLGMESYTKGLPCRSSYFTMKYSTRVASCERSISGWRRQSLRNASPSSTCLWATPFCYKARGGGKWLKLPRLIVTTICPVHSESSTTHPTGAPCFILLPFFTSNDDTESKRINFYALLLQQWASQISVPGNEILLHSAQNKGATHTATCPVATSALSVRGYRWRKHEADHSPPSGAQINNAWSFPTRLHGVVLSIIDTVIILKVQIQHKKQKTSYTRCYLLEI
jgi:hypothetical protein